MTDSTAVVPEAAPSNKELNFRAIERNLAQERAEKAQLQQQVAQERAAREELERRFQSKDEEPYTEPYVDEKRLNKKLERFEENNSKKTSSEIHRAVSIALQEERNNNWIEQNPDFYEILDNNVKKFTEVAPGLAKSILDMPDTFERKKLVYNNIKALRLHEPQVKQSSIQDKVDSNRRSPYYQPSGVGTAPYASAGNFTPSGQKDAYDKMKDLQKRMRIG